MLKKCKNCKEMSSESCRQYVIRVRKGMDFPFYCKECLRIQKALSSACDQELLLMRQKNREIKSFQKKREQVITHDAEFSPIVIMRKQKVTLQEAIRIIQEKKNTQVAKT